MTTKRKLCAYKNCKSDNANPSCTETFFSFPRELERYKLWVNLSHCNDNNNLIDKDFKQNSKAQKYLCSKHFDHKRYMSSNPRRKLLLSTAIPFEYESSAGDSENDEGGNEMQENNNANNKIIEQIKNGITTLIEMPGFKINNISNDDDNDFDDDETYTIEQTNHQVIDDDDYGQVEVEYFDNNWSETYILPSIDDESIPKIQHYENLPDSRTERELKTDNVLKTYSSCRKIQQYVGRKRKITDTAILDDNNSNNKFIKSELISNNKKMLKTPSSNLNIVEEKERIVNIEQYSNNDDDDDDNDDDNDDILLSNPYLSSFTWNNEEYIKMPKVLYCHEKRELLNQIKYYKEIILNFKKQLLHVKL